MSEANNKVLPKTGSYKKKQENDTKQMKNTKQFPPEEGACDHITPNS
jgi:hypothetical protein